MSERQTLNTNQHQSQNSVGPQSSRMQKLNHYQTLDRRGTQLQTQNQIQRVQPVIQYQSQPSINGQQNQINLQFPHNNINSIAVLQQQATTHHYGQKPRNGAPHTTPNVKIYTARNSQYNQQIRTFENLELVDASSHTQQNLNISDNQNFSQVSFQGSRQSPINQNSEQPVLVSYNIKNGLYIRPNSPNNQSRGQVRGNVNNVYYQILPHSQHQNNRLNNTATSQITGILEEEKNLDPTPTPLEEFKQEHNLLGQFRLRPQYGISQPPLPTEEDNLDQVLPQLIQMQSSNIENNGEERFVPPPTANLYSPPHNTPPNEQVMQSPIQYQQIQPNNQHSSIFNSAPLLSPNQSEIWNIAANLTAATTHTVGSTGVGTAQINMTPSDLRSQAGHYIFHGENPNQQVILLQRPPPPSPLKTDEIGAQSEMSCSSQPQIILINECRDDSRNDSSSYSISQQQSFVEQQSLNGSMVQSRQASIVSSVYQEVLENQQKSNQTTLKGLELVLDENEKLKQRIQLLENEVYRLQNQNNQQRMIINDHIRTCTNHQLPNTNQIL